ncbi:peptidylprolyl isomerase [candidate division WOR-3 bacterium]|nr:peptidylprolyl isomerase [candidate division WOR-3 bacterium]
MNPNRYLLFVFFVSLIISGCGNRHDTAPAVLLQTELGDIVVVIDVVSAPITARNFLRYVDEDRFKEAFFYRVVRLDNQPHNDVKIEVIQGGIGFVESDLRLPPIVHENTEKTGLLHKDGVISMARREPGTASSELFICVGDQPELDFGGKRNPDDQGFAAFGRVIQGMDVVRTIHGQSADGQTLISPVRISGFKRVKEHGPVTE